MCVYFQEIPRLPDKWPVNMGVMNKNAVHNNDAVRDSDQFEMFAVGPLILGSARSTHGQRTDYAQSRKFFCCLAR
jgi:hypothetical protein